MAYKFQFGDARMSGSLTQEEGLTVDSGGATITAGGLAVTAGGISVTAGAVALNSVGITAAGSIAGVTTFVASSTVTGAAGSFTALDGTSLALQSGGITAAGSIAGATTVAMGGALTGVTTLAASGLASVASISMDDGSTLGPDSVADLWTFSADGDTVQKDGTYDFNLASHDGTNGLKLAGTLVVATAAEIDYNADVTAGTAIASKSIVLDASKDSTGMRSLTGSGDAYFGGLYSDGALRAAGNAQFDGSVALGNATGDNLQFNGRAASNFVPDSDSARDLGADALRWSTIYVDSIVGASVAWDVVKCHSADTISASAELAIILEGNGITVNLPAATTGRNIRVKLSASVGDVLIAPASGEIIEGLAADAKVRLESTGSSVTFACMETDGWVIL